MDLLPSQEQLELAGLAAEFFADQLPISRIRERRAEPAAITRETWAAAAELGLLGVSAAEDVGGLGLGLDDEVLLFREMGRQLVPGPFVASVLGARLAALAGDAGAGPQDRGRRRHRRPRAAPLRPGTRRGGR